MKKHFILLVSIIIIATSAFAQKEFRLAATSGRLSLNIPGVILEGYNGNEIIFSIPEAEMENVDGDVDERAAGLRVLSGAGFGDNTGLGFNVSQKGTEITVNEVGLDRSTILTIRIPQNIKVAINNTGSTNLKEVILKNLTNEIEVSTSYNKITLENNTGPMNIKSLYGSIDAVFANDIKGPVSIVSVYGHVDVSIPKATKANVKMSTSYGKVYAAEGLKIALDVRIDAQADKVKASSFSFSSGDSDVITINSNGSSRLGGNINGKINGGGADIILKSSYKNVYLRDE